MLINQLTTGLCIPEVFVWFFFNEKCKLSVREERCPVSGYGLFLSDMFFEVEFSFFFNLRRCTPSLYKSESISIFKVEVKKE